MTDDILAQAEDLMREATSSPISDQIIYECYNLFPQLLAEAKLWKAKAIEERATVLEIGNREYGDGTLDDDDAKKQAESELRAEGVIE